VSFSFVHTPGEIEAGGRQILEVRTAEKQKIETGLLERQRARAATESGN